MPPHSFPNPKPDQLLLLGEAPHGNACVLQDGRADVVANDAGDRVTPAIVAYSENEEVSVSSPALALHISSNDLHCDNRGGLSGGRIGSQTE